MTNRELEFEFYLARELGGMTVGELRERMGADEFLHWQAYYALRAQQLELEQKKAKGGRRV